MSITPEDLIRHLYKENSFQERLQIDEALANDWTLNEKYQVLLAAHSRLNTIIESPQVSSISAILHYAEKSLHHTA